MALYRSQGGSITANLKETDKDRRIREYRREASRLSAMANKRLQRLERNNLTSTPAYQRWLADGGEKFGVKGKTYNEVQAEVSRLRRFIDAETSTIRGANKVLKQIAENTGIKYSNLTDLRSRASNFFELASKVEQYLRTVDDIASAIGYQKIWDAINQYTDEMEIDLSESELDIDSMVGEVTRAIDEYDSPLRDRVNKIGTQLNWYRVKD